MENGGVAVVGAGVTGASAAFELARRAVPVTLFERDATTGGRIRTGPFAGLDHVDCAADSMLARVPDAVALAADVGLGDDLVHPEPVGAAVWHDGLHDVPDGLVLGVPGDVTALARSGLLSWRGKLRAAVEPLLPRTPTDDDSLGGFVRARFGDEVHERLVDALVGSIYATDTDRFSLAEVPQLAALADSRSLLLAARRSAGGGTATARTAPIFAAPRDGLGALVAATIDAAVREGADVQTGSAVAVEPDGPAWRLAGERFDAVVVAGSAADAAIALRADPTLRSVCESLSEAETADVVMITLHVPDDEWPERLCGRSGYLVPKPVQRHLTAVSFGSQKWAHWAPPAGGQILRASVGRDGVETLHLDDDELVDRALDDLRLHLGCSFSPSEVRINRWPGAFAQYRPHHRRWVDRVRADLPPGLFLAGSSYDGIGIPACIRSGRTIAELAADHHDAVRK